MTEFLRIISVCWCSCCALLWCKAALLHVPPEQSETEMNSIWASHSPPLMLASQDLHLLLCLYAFLSPSHLFCLIVYNIANTRQWSRLYLVVIYVYAPSPQEVRGIQCGGQGCILWSYLLCSFPPQEVPLEKAKLVLKIIAGYKHTTSIFDDFSHYEKRQEEEEDVRKVLAIPTDGFIVMVVVICFMLLFLSYPDCFRGNTRCLCAYEMYFWEKMAFQTIVIIVKMEKNY